jgi:type IV secretory pathway ATPase VirB11/archaellum biosynthesis ATPase
MIIQRTRVTKYLNGQIINTNYEPFDDARLEEIVVTRPGTEFVIEVNEFNTETKRYEYQWERFYEISAESIATKAI